MQLTPERLGVGRLIYGGTFNPIHIGHMRLAIESLELLAGKVDALDFVPAALPPHKRGQGLLPFALRARMIDACLEDQPRMNCNLLEGKRSNLSYTYDTLEIYRNLYKDEELYFLLGSQDYNLLREWRKGLELPDLCTLVIVPRGNFSPGDFENATCDLWPKSRPFGTSERKLSIMSLPGERKVIYAPLPWLDISSSLIRQYWLGGRSVEYLMPAKALQMLEMEKPTVMACWREDC